MTAPDDGNHPPPPRRGTRAHRTLILMACAAPDSFIFRERLMACWELYGWRAALDIITETLYQYCVSPVSGSFPRDVFGHYDLSKRMGVFQDPGARLSYATARSEDEDFAELAPHERFKEAIGESERINAATVQLAPHLQHAINAIQDSGNQEAARPIIAKYLNSTEDREDAAAEVAFLTYGALRRFAMSPGDEWVEAHLDKEFAPKPVIGASLAYYGGLTPDQEEQVLPGWMARRPEPPPGARKRVRRRRGGVHPSNNPDCTCGEH